MTMDDERDDSGNEQDPPVLRSGRVRIVGAEPVAAGTPGEAEDQPDSAPPAAPETLGTPLPEGGATPAPAGSAPPRPGDEEPFLPLTGAPLSALGPEDAAPATFEPLPDLPHWTEAPTGEVPAVLARDTGGTGNDAADRWSTMPAPTWREEHTDWEAHEETFEPSMLAQDESRLGSLDDSGQSDRQPWSFDLPGAEHDEVSAPGGPAAPADPGAAGDINRHDDQDTMIVPAVRVLGGADGAPAPRDAEPAESATVPAAGPSDEDGPVGTAGPDAESDRVVVPDVDGAATRPAVPGPAEGPGLADDATTTMAVGASSAGTGVEPRRRRTSSGRRRNGSKPAPARPVPLSPDEGGEDPRPSGRVRRSVPPAPEPAPAPRRAVPRPRPGGGLRPPEPPVEARSGRDLQAAVVSGVAIGVIALICFKLGTVASVTLITVLAALAVIEAYAAFRKAGYHPATLLGIVATVSLMIATYNKGLEALPLVIVLVIAFTLLWHIVGVEKVPDPVQSTAATVFVFCWIGVFASFAALLLNPTLFPDRHGIAFLLGAIIAAVAYDIGALAVGAWIGRHPLAPSISPNKTWEGCVGGAVAAVLASVIIVHFISPWTLGKAAALGLVVAVVSPIGDLGESLVKRGLGLKDMGRILPGHGGLLDRLDGLLFVLPATYYLVKAVHLG
ncbi:MAG: phosphatidate cytidylyltransferase [Acidimicrobiales bacterium]